MTSPALSGLYAARDKALADPAINTGTARATRLTQTVRTIERGITWVPRPVLDRPYGLLDVNVLGHPDQPSTLLGRIAAGQCRAKPPYTALTPATLRSIMDGIADLNEAVGNPPYWWDEHGARPWSKHTREPMTEAHRVILRRELSVHQQPEREPYRLRTLTVLELLWDTGVTPSDLLAANTDDLSDDLSKIKLTWNPPGRTAPSEHTYALSASARAAVAQWLPVRDDVVERSLRKGNPRGSRALIVTLWHSGSKADGTYHPAGTRLLFRALSKSWSQWVRALNTDHAGQPGWPLPRDLYGVARGGTHTPSA